MVFLLVLPLTANTQALRCDVTVNSEQIAQVDKNVFDQMEKSIRQFMNNTSWTNNVYKEFERIEMAIFININARQKTSSGEAIPNRYTATLTISARRPVYNTSFYCQLFNYKDPNFEFSYQPFQKLFYSNNTGLDNLTSILAFYAYYIIGLDKETFALNGGEKSMLQAMQIVQSAQNFPQPGWRPNESLKNRYWLVNDYMNSAFEPLRAIMYNYHRNGFDVLESDLMKGRQNIIDALKRMNEIWKQRPNAFLVQLFYTTKRQEIIEMLKASPNNIVAEILPTLKKTDPAYGAKYEELLQ